MRRPGAAGCGADLADPASGASDAGAAWAQVWDTLPVMVEKVHWWLPPRRCGCCKKITTATGTCPGRVRGVRAEHQRRRHPAVLRGQRPGRADRRADGGAAGHAGVERVRRPRPGPAGAAAPGRGLR